MKQDRKERENAKRGDEREERGDLALYIDKISPSVPVSALKHK